MGCFKQQSRQSLHSAKSSDMPDRHLPWREQDWNDRLKCFNQADGLEIVLFSDLDNESLLYPSSPFVQGLLKSSFRNVAIHSNVQEIVFTYGLEKVGSRHPARCLLLGLREDGWYYNDSNL